jgi:hypothetical protein
METTLATKDDINRLEKQIAVVKWMMGVMLAGVVSLVLNNIFHALKSNRGEYLTGDSQWK